MARKIRIEYPGAAYHVINRGNYRADIFATDGAREAFIKALDEACERTGWIIHAWCLMSNHYHLALSTPQPNLADGMQWFQGTFCTRFNRFRNEKGHVFQGRYKAFNIQPGRTLGSVCHYTHLNPIRAKMMSMEQLAKWPWSSLAWILKPQKRKVWFSTQVALHQSAELEDTPAGRRAYVEYLAWLSADEEEQKRQCFERMTKGWIMGSEDFARRILHEADKLPEAVQQEFGATREEIWAKELTALKARLDAGEMRERAKSADWKVALAAEMKRHTTATNRWLSEALGMGSMFTVSRLTKECRTGRRAVIPMQKLIMKSKGKA